MSWRIGVGVAMPLSRLAAIRAQPRDHRLALPRELRRQRVELVDRVIEEQERGRDFEREHFVDRPAHFDQAIGDRDHLLGEA